MTRTGQFTLCSIALMPLLVPCVEASSEAPFPLFYEGSEALVLHRLELDPSTERVADLSDARAAVFQNQLPAPGPQLDELRSRVESGMGLLIKIDVVVALAMAALGAVRQGMAKPEFRFIAVPPSPRLLHGSSFGYNPSSMPMTAREAADADDRAENAGRWIRMGQGHTPLPRWWHPDKPNGGWGW